jgi:predicted porin
MMKKALIPAVLALGFAGAAQAQLSLYGLIDASYGKSLFSEAFIGKSKADFHSGGDNGSSEGNSTTRVGIKGAVDVGGGVKANFRFETGGITSRGEVNVDPFTGDTGPFFNRQAWVGLSGSFGEVRLGRQDSVSFQQMIDFDFNGASNGVSAGGYAGVGVWLPGRQSRSLQYIAPPMGGFSAQFGFVPKGDNVNRGEPKAKNVFSAGAKYAAGPLTIGASVQTKSESDTKQFASVAGSYDLGVAKVMLGYADGGKISQKGSGSGPTFGVNFPVAGFNIGAHYANNRDKDAEITSIEGWINKEVFKNTYAYLEFGDWKSDKITIANGKKKATGYAAGLIFVF